MQDMWKSLKSNKNWPIVGLFVLFFVAVFVGLLLRTLEDYRLSPDTRPYYRAESRLASLPAQVFLPSPLEVHLLDTEESLWPDLFNPEERLEPIRLPDFYSAAARLPSMIQVSRIELEEARQRSVLQHAGRFEELRSSFTQPTEEDIQNETECSPLMQETLYRASVAWPDLEDSTLAYLQRCDPMNLHVKWKQLVRALRQGDVSGLEAASKLFQQDFSKHRGEWSRWFSMEASQLAHVMSARLQDTQAK